jgi:hypothetical protein
MKAVKALEAKGVKPRLPSCLGELRFPMVREAFATAAEQVRQESLSYEHDLLESANWECEERGAETSGIPAHRD